MNYYKYVEEFRDKVNKYDDFLISQYQENNDKNHWNLICSAMDWMTVSADYLNKKSYVDKNSYSFSIELYSVISSIDIIWEAVQQLNRVFFTNTTPLKGNKAIFKDERLKLDDNCYFKHLRAAFGAHSVNKKENKEFRRFASWSYRSYELEHDYSVRLYSSDKDHEDITIGFKLDQLFDFLDKRIVLLDNVIKQIEIQYDKHNKKMCKEVIPLVDDKLEQIGILKKENGIRLRNEMYSCTLDELSILLRTEISEKYKGTAIRDFHNLLCNTVDQIYDCLQNMRYSDIPYFNYTNDIPNSINYAFGKLNDIVLHDNPRPLFEINEIIDFLDDYIRVEQDISNEELYYIFLAYIPHFSISETETQNNEIYKKLALSILSGEDILY